MVDVPVRKRSLLKNWRYVLRTSNAPRGHVDPVSRWLVLTRASVLPMTLTSALIAGLLAVRQPGFNAGLFLLAAVGIQLAHAANNLMNDLFDLEVGSDTKEYPRALYAPHPILSGMTTKAGLIRATLLVNAIDAAILVALLLARGWPVVAFAAGGFLISAGYTAPPVRLKRRGLGEPGVFLVWGPLMVGGTYYAAVGNIPWHVVAASVPYALLATSVLFGKHIDKLEWDTPLRIRTLPVLLGEARARRTNQALMIAFYVSIVVFVATRALPPAALVSLLALPRLVPALKAYSRPRPAERPVSNPVWPLWFAPIAFLHTRRAGLLLLAGLAVAAALPR
jgi:1,4-dihydroxy-2-naphthoate octaprenyltransferase